METKQEDSTVKASILGVNNLVYALQPDLSVAVSRTMIKQFPQAQKHTSRDSMIFTLNSGSSYIDFRDSYLSIDVTNLSNAGSAWFGSAGGSACNFFNRLTITSRSGQVLERIDRANQLAAIRVLYEKSPGWLATAGSLMGAGVSAANLAWTPSTSVRFIIPLGCLSVFANTCKQLVPAQCASGMRIELLLEDGAKSMVQSEGTATSSAYEITAASLNLQSYLLSDVVLRTLNEMSASSGLEIVHETVYGAVGQRSSTMLTTELGKSASRCLKALYHERPVTTSLQADPFASPVYSSSYYVQELQYRLGAQYFPNTSIRGDSARQSAPELYASTLQAFGQLPSAVPTMCVSEANFRNGAAVYAQSFERSNTLDLAGQPSSNSRIINLVARFVDTSTSPRESEFFLFFAQLIRVFSSNSVVEQ
jgi:hypothetical protein